MALFRCKTCGVYRRNDPDHKEADKHMMANPGHTMEVVRSKHQVGMVARRRKGRP